MLQKLTVIICTYNPEKSIFNRCLAAIEKASEICLPYEIIIVDNNSDLPLINQEYINSFLTKNKAILVIETKQGLTPARLKGINEAKGDLLLFIDDDNFINEDFFLIGLKIANKYPFIGAFSGQVELEFEIRPKEWTKKYWGLLVYRRFKSNYWSNLLNNGETMPCGAGLFVKRSVSNYYLELHTTGKRNIQLDRSGNSLLSGGDNDLALCACDIGLGVGLFHELYLTHFIPKKRTELTYLLNLTKAITTSSILLHSFRGIGPTESSGIKSKLLNITKFITKNKIDKKFHLASLSGEREGRKILKKVK